MLRLGYLLEFSLCIIFFLISNNYFFFWTVAYFLSIRIISMNVINFPSLFFFLYLFIPCTFFPYFLLTYSPFISAFLFSPVFFIFFAFFLLSSPIFFLFLLLFLKFSTSSLLPCLLFFLLYSSRFFLPSLSLNLSSFFLNIFSVFLYFPFSFPNLLSRLPYDRDNHLPLLWHLTALAN